MTRRTGATLPVRFAVPVLIAAICAVATGCSQLLGITDITAADGAATDTATDGGFSADTMGSDASANDSSGDDAAGDAAGARDALSDDTQNGVDAISCSMDLSNVHTGDFLISFRMQTNQTDNFIGLLNQRTVCVGLGLFWDAMLVNQHIRLELSESMNQSRYVTLVSSGAPLNDNKPHDVVITRTNDAVNMMIDGQSAGSKTMDQNLGSLPPLRVGKGACNGVVTIREAITNVCVRPN